MITHPFFSLFLLILVQLGFQTELRVVPLPQGSDLQQLGLMKSLRRYRTRRINLNSQQYICTTAIKQKMNNTATPFPGKHKFVQNDDVFSHSLKLLQDDKGVEFITKQFVYVYRHGIIVSQVDDYVTMASNGKKKYENFTMGTTVEGLDSKVQPEHEWNVKAEKAVEKLLETDKITILTSQGVQISVNDENGYKQMISKTLSSLKNQKKTKKTQPQNNPLKHDFSYHELSLKRVQEFTQKQKMAFEIDRKNSLIRSPMPMTTASLSMTHQAVVLCKADENGTISYEFKGKLISGFQILVPKAKLNKCFKVENVHIVLNSHSDNQKDKKQKMNSERGKIEFQQSHLNSNVEISSNLIFGGLDKFCKNPVGSPLININDTLLLQIIPVAPKQGSSPNFMFVKVQQILGEAVYRIDRKVVADTLITSCKRMRKVGGHSREMFGIGGGKSLLLVNLPTSFERSDIEHKTAQCVMGNMDLEVESLDPLEETQLTIGSHFSQRYYESYTDANLRANETGFFICALPKEKPQSQAMEKQQESSFSQVFKIESSSSFSQAHHRKYIISNGKDNEKDNIHIVTIGMNSIIEVNTQDGVLMTRNRYYLTPKKIYQVKVGKEGRSQNLENSYYANHTDNNVVIIYQGIWRAGDFYKFPRFLMSQNEHVTAISAKEGYGYVRQINTGILGMNDLVITSGKLREDSGQYGPYVRPTQSMESSKLLQKGTHCGGKINKDRETLVRVKCGESWFAIREVSELSPCSYQLQIQSQFLCAKNVTFPPTQPFNIFQGGICIPEL